MQLLILCARFTGFSKLAVSQMNMAIHSLPNELDDSSNETYSYPEPRVKLPDVVARKPMVPGSNSWAPVKELEKPPPRDTVGTQPTNRERYEGELPTKATSQDRQESPLSAKIYIQPAVPLMNTLTPSQKNRAVTDPVQFRSLLKSKKPSVSQLKKKGKFFEFASSKHDLTESIDLSRLDVAPKALKVLGVERGSTPTLQPASESVETAVPIQTLIEHASTHPPPPSNQARPNIAPVQLSSVEWKDPSSKARNCDSTRQNIVSEQSHSDVSRNNIGEPYRVQREVRNENLGVPKVLGYGNVGKQRHIVEQQGMHPSASFHGVIETASPSRVDQHGNEHQQHVALMKSIQREPSGEMLRPITYSPRHYGNVWENNSAVDYTLHPFTPIPKSGHPNHEHVPRGLASAAPNAFSDSFEAEPSREESGNNGSPAMRVQGTSTKLASHMKVENFVPQPQQVRRSQSRSATGPSTSQLEPTHTSQLHNGFEGNVAHYQQQYPAQYAQHGLRQAVFDSRPYSAFDHPLPTANSWAPSTGGYPGPSQAPISALLPQHWPGHLLHNPVPSPPASQQNYQRPSPLSAGLAQLDLTLHHHIDSVFGSLSKQIADKHDRVLDRVLLRVDNLEDNILKELKGLKTDLNSVKKEVGKLQASVSQISQSHDSISKESQILSSKTDSLEKRVAQIGCKDHIRFADQSNSEFDAKRSHRRLNHHGTESARGSLSRSPLYRDQREPSSRENGAASRAASRASSRARQNINSIDDRIGRTRSRAGTGGSQQGSEAWNATLAQLATMGRNDPVPDLRDHPAYQDQINLSGTRTNQISMEDNSATEGLVDGDWYRQAYGKGI